MNYELAKKLKDAGLPQTSFFFLYETDKYFLGDGYIVDKETAQNIKTDHALVMNYNDLVFIPSLAYLILSCRDDFAELIRTKRGYVALEGKLDFEEGDEFSPEDPDGKWIMKGTMGHRAYWGFASNDLKNGLIMVHCREDFDAVAQAYRQGVRAGIKKEKERIKKKNKRSLTN